MKPTVIPVFYHTEESRQAKELGMDYTIEDCKVKEVTFYTIDLVSYFEEEGRIFGEIHSSGLEFSSPLTPEEINKLIQG